MRIKESIIYVDREDIKAVEEEEREAFVRGIIAGFGLEHPQYKPFDELWPENSLLTPEQRATLRKFLSEFDVEIIRNGEREVQIYVNGALAAEWLTPFVALKTDMSQPNHLKRVFAEMHIKRGSNFEGE